MKSILMKTLSHIHYACLSHMFVMHVCHALGWVNIFKVGGTGAIWKNLCRETAVQKDFAQKSIFARAITFEKWPKKWEIVIFS